MISRAQSDFLNYSRFIASLVVVMGHARAAFFPAYANFPGHTLLSKLFYFLTGFGHEAVMMFFVISGFLVGGKVADLYERGGFSWKFYVVDRFSRLYIVFLPALIFGWAIDSIGMRFAPSALYMGGADLGIAILPRSIEASLSAEAFVGNALMLQTIFVPTFGSNGPLWSLANEFWYYLLFPAILGAVFARGPLRLLYLAASLTMLAALTPSILILFGIWLIGVGVSRIRRVRFPVAVAGAVLSVTLVAVRLGVVKGVYISPFLVGLSFGLLLVSLASVNRPFPVSEYAQRLADFSYSLYLTHFPVLLLIASWLHLKGMGALHRPTLSTALIYSVTVVILVIIGFLFSLATERHTQVLRRKLRDWFVGPIS